MNIKVQVDKIPAFGNQPRVTIQVFAHMKTNVLHYLLITMNNIKKI